MSEYGLAVVIALGIPTGILLSMWRYARRQLPDFRIQFSIFELWLLALCSSPAFLITTIRFERVSIAESLFLLIFMLLNQASGAFFMYVLERLTPEPVRASPMPMVLFAGCLLGWTIFPATTYLIIVMIYIGLSSLG